jgi:sugar phosphate isomerase/epimerase
MALMVSDPISGFRRIEVRIGIWTSFYIDLPPEDAFQRFADLGWRDLEVSAEHGKMATQDENWRERLGGLRRLCEKNGMKLWQMHAPLELDVADPDPQKREKDIDTATKWAEYSHELGLPHLVIHPGGRQRAQSDDEKEEIIALNLDAFSRLAEVASRFNVKFCLENMQERMGQEKWRLGARISDINELIDAVGSEALGICFDSSHANVTKLDMSQAIHECGDRLLATHISDNDGSGDQHKLPFNGNINWESVVSALKDIGYAGLFNLEIPGENRVPLPVRDARLKYAKEVLEYMMESF